jgi:hypothetical protein
MLLAAGLRLAGQAGKSPQAGKGTRMSKQTDDAKEQLAQFDMTKDPAQLEGAIRDLEHAELPPEQGEDRLAARREAMVLWLALLAALQKAKDPAFDPNDLPMASLAPPPGSSGVRYPAGIDPNAIPEADVRAKYQAALAKNRQKVDTHRLQSRLLFLEGRAQPDVEGFISRNYSKSGPDRGELRELVGGAQIPPQQKQRLLSIQSR